MDDATRRQIEAARPTRSTWLSANAGAARAAQMRVRTMAQALGIKPGAGNEAGLPPARLPPNSCFQVTVPARKQPRPVARESTAHATRRYRQCQQPRRAVPAARRRARRQAVPDGEEGRRVGLHVLCRGGREGLPDGGEPAQAGPARWRQGGDRGGKSPGMVHRRPCHHGRRLHHHAGLHYEYRARSLPYPR